MAEAVVSFAVERLGDLLISEAKLLHGVINQIKKVKRELERMECFLEEADKKETRDKRVRQWVGEIRELAFKIEDIIETFAMKVASKKQNSDLKETLLRFSCILSEGVSRHNIATEISDIKAELIDLTACLQTYGITKGLEEGESSNSLLNLKSRRIFYSLDVEQDFVGMEKEIKQLIFDLKKKGNSCKVVSIYGMGGLGKTTLAQKLYNHVEVKAHFEAFSWICITQQFDREKVLQGVLKQLVHADREGEVSRMDDAKLVEELRKVQQEKKCLIVIDDIWTIDSWRSLEHAFLVRETTSGSKILLTTRNATVGEIGSIHKIQALTEKEGWQLFAKKARIDDHSGKKVFSHMERIGKNMVQRCKGLPLAISTLGGILKGKSLKGWELINKDIPFYLAKGDGVSNDDEYYTVTWVLGLSYDSLPARLRHCFLSFANYKEDEVIDTEKLYMFWMTEGLISVEDKAEGEMMLDVAERYLDELAHRSLVQVETGEIEGQHWSKYRTCRVHDLIFDLCLSKVKEEKVIKIINLQRKPDDESKESLVRRLCIRSYNDGDETMLKLYDEHVISHIRSLLVRKDSKYTKVEWPDKILSLKKFKLLRVLIVNKYIFSRQNIRSISELVYLKYLCLGDCVLEELPSSIGNLKNLETLDLRVSNSITIPNVLWKLKRLRHLYLPKECKDGGRVEKLRLEGLNELELVYNYNSKCCDTHDLFQLPKLKVFGGKIIVENNLTAENIIDFVNSRELRHSKLRIVGGGVSCLVLLSECCFIDILKIGTGKCIISKDYDHTHLSGRLTRLELKKCGMQEDPMILLEKLPNLRDLSLCWNAYMGAEMVCSARGFLQLQHFSLYHMHYLKKWSVGEGAMPNLSNLLINACYNLEMLPQGLTYLTSLKTLTVQMPSTFKNRIKVINDVEGEDFYKIRHIPNVFIY